MRVAVSGTNGFLGKALVRQLLEAGIGVVAIRRPASAPAASGSTSSRLEFVESDAPDLSQRLSGVDALVNTACSFGRMGESAAEVVRANVEYPLQLLDAARTARIGMFINAGTSLVPELGAYALTKHQFAQWGRQIAAASPIGFINVRLEHLYGPGDGPGKLVTYLIGMCLDNRPEIPLTTGEQKRDFIFIHDAVAAFLELIRAAPRIGGGFHEFPVGSGRSITIRQLAEDIHRMTASTSSLRFGAIPYRPHEPMESRADLSAIRHLGWSPATPLEAGLRSTIAAAIAERHAPDSARPGNARR